MKKLLLTKLALLLVMLVGSGSSWAEDVTDELTQSWTGVTGTNYSSWSSKTLTSGAVYAGQSAGGYSSIQLRSNNNNSGVVTTTSGGKVKKITVTWNSNTASGRTLNVYGKNSAYSAATDLYNSTNQGTLLGTIVYGTSTELAVTDDYEYIGFRSASGAMYLEKVQIVWETSGGSSLNTSDLALTGAPVSLNFDLYNNSDAQIVTFTTSSTGAVTVDESEYVTTSVSGNTIMVTPVKVTPSVQTITVNQAADDSYSAGSATFTVSIASSAPYVQPTEFDINLNDKFFGTTYGGSASGITDDVPVVGAKDNVTVTYAGSGNHYINDSQIRFYPNNKLTFEAPNGYEITEIVFTSDGTWAATISANCGSYDSNSKTWTGNATSVVFAGSGSSRCDISKASIKIAPIGSAVATTTTIDATGITNTNVFDGTAAGSLTAAVTLTEGGAAVTGASVTWSGDNDAVATIDAATGAVTLVAAGTVTFTASYAGVVDEYKASSATYEMTVTNSDPNAPGTENNPYTVAQAIANTPSSGTSANVYIKGKVSAFYSTSIVGDGSNYRYYISDDGTTTNQLLVYKGKGQNNVAFSSADDLLVGDEVVICGGLTTYNNTKEVAANNYIVSLTRPVDPSVATTTTIDATGITNTDVSVGTAAGSLTAAVTVTEGGAAVSGATVTWTSSNPSVATIADDGTVTLVAAGTTIITASYAGVADEYKSSSDTYELTVTKQVYEYATLPYTFDGGRSDIEYADGLTHSGLGSDYSSSPKLKFDGSGDYLVLKIDENPGILTFDIKGNSFSGGTFTVQISEDGETYDNLKVFNAPAAETQTYKYPLPLTTRYIKWIYTEKVSGNVALGNISLSKPVSVTSNGWATFVTPCDVQFDAGNAFIVIDASVAGGLTLSEVTKVPADSPILLKGEGEKAMTALSVAPKALDDMSSNKLSVCDGTIESGKYAYVLAKEGAGAAFKQWTGKASVLKDRVVLLLDEAVSAARSIFMLDGDNTTTGIAQIENEASKMEGSVYNLNGQRVNSPKKGLYIVNGKKVMMK